MKKRTLLLILCCTSIILQAQVVIDLSGNWKFQIDREDVGIKEHWFRKQLTDSIYLPGSMPEMLKGDKPNINTQWTASLYDSSYFFNPYMEKYRVEENFKVPFFLTPDRYYVGPAWYQKEVTVPADWKNERIILFLERPHIETTVWVNNRQAGVQNSLSVPHVYDITPLISAGKNKISIRVDNRIKDINVGIDAHSITDHTQGNWNGIVGKIILKTTPKIYFDDIQVYPDLSNKKAVVKMVLKSTSSTATPVHLKINAQSFNSDKVHTLTPISHDYIMKKGILNCEMVLEMGNNMLTWDEFNPALYKLTAELTNEKKKEVKQIQFGMREFAIKGKWFYVNGRQTQLRGTVECCTFPLTGYPPTDVKSWERIFRICRSSGLNHIRFHSYCPPEAAFIAADLVGIYLQPEGPAWPNHGVRLGNGAPIDKYLMDETIRLTREYGNYASYCMLASGNEPSGNWVAWVTDFVKYWEKTDPRRVYTGASVGNGWQWQPQNQFHVKAGARGLNWKNEQPESISDYREKIDTVMQPYISHENGQWCVFPNFDEIRKYTGVNKAKNYEMFRDILHDNHMGHKAHDFMMASGKLQALCYKHEIEKTLRTPDYAGFQLLGLNDFPGQGNAIIGLLDAFYGEKGYITPKETRRFCGPTVPLARIPKFTYKNDEIFHATIEVSHFGNAVLDSTKTTYTIRDEYGKIYYKEISNNRTIPVGNCIQLGEVNYPLASITSPAKLNLEVCIEGTHFANDWDFWVYPAVVETNQGNVYITDTFNEKALETLASGGNVLITAARKITYGQGIVQQFTPVFWNTSWFKMRPPHTTGIWVNNNHPLFKNFPTEYHSNLQWWELLNNAQVMLFSDFAYEFEPLVQSIDTWFLSRKIGTLFEAHVLNGKLMMTSMDITTDLDNRIVARQMRKAILDYMNSPHFRPVSHVKVQQIEDLFRKPTPVINMHTKQSPEELKPSYNVK